MTPGRVLGVIPARYGAKRFPGKPLAEVAGKPLVVRVLENARRASCFDRLVVATDDERIAEAVREAGGEAVLTDPYLPSGTDRVRAAAVALGGGFDRVVNVQGDEPLLPPAAIDAAVRALDACEIATLAAPITSVEDFRDPDVVKVVTTEDGRALYFSRAPIPFPRSTDAAHGVPAGARMHIGLYAFRAEALKRYAAIPPGGLEMTEGLEQLRWLAAGAEIRVVDLARATIGVDRPEDVARVEAALAAGGCSEGFVR